MQQPQARPARAMRPITAVAFAVVYMIIMAIGWIVDPYEYGTAGNLFYQTPFLVVALIYTYTLIRMYRVPVVRAGRLRAPWPLFAVIVIMLIDAVGAVYSLAPGFHGKWVTIPAMFVSTMIVGFAEEGMFRGLITTGLARRMSTGKALLISSVLFGFLHAVNILAHAAPGAVAFQVIFTMFVGYALGTVYIRSGGSLLLVALLHGFYDFFVFATSYGTASGGQTLMAISIVNLAAWFILSFVLLFRNRGRLPDLAAMRKDSEQV